MIDMHNHVLFGVDDGAQTLEDSLSMVHTAMTQGFTAMVLTPHYMIYEGYTSTVEENTKRLKTLREAMDREGLAMDLYLGSELFYDYQLVDHIGRGDFTTLGDSGYYLVETGRQGGTALGIQNFMAKLDGTGTILAHPERYDFIQEDPNLLLDYMASGTLIQSNYLSLIGYYGQVAQHTMEAMLRSNMVQLLGSDAHQSEGYALYAEAKAAGEALVGALKWKELTETNSLKIMGGQGGVNVAPKHHKPAIHKGVIGKFFV